MTGVSAVLDACECDDWQGGGKRKGAFAIYLEPWHSDIFDWLDLRKNHGKEENRCRDLFYGLWVNDLFMKVRGNTVPYSGGGVLTPHYGFAR